MKIDTKRPRLEELDHSEDSMVQNSLGLFVLLLSGVVFGSYFFCYHHLEEKDKPVIWYENLSGIPLPEGYLSDLKHELIAIGFPNTKVLRRGINHWPTEGQAQIYFLHANKMLQSERKQIPYNLHGEASSSQRKIHIYLNKVIHFDVDADDLTDLTLHEIGHAMGNLNHVDDPINLMYPYLDYSLPARRPLNPDQIMNLHKDWYSKEFSEKASLSQ